MPPAAPGCSARLAHRGMHRPRRGRGRVLTPPAAGPSAHGITRSRCSCNRWAPHLTDLLHTVAGASPVRRLRKPGAPPDPFSRSRTGYLRTFPGPARRSGGARCPGVCG
jgi:hypothetical protein